MTLEYFLPLLLISQWTITEFGSPCVCVYVCVFVSVPPLKSQSVCVCVRACVLVCGCLCVCESLCFGVCVSVCVHYIRNCWAGVDLCWLCKYFYIQCSTGEIKCLTS